MPDEKDPKTPLDVGDDRGLLGGIGLLAAAHEPLSIADAARRLSDQIEAFSDRLFQRRAVGDGDLLALLSVVDDALQAHVNPAGHQADDASKVALQSVVSAAGTYLEKVYPEAGVAECIALIEAVSRELEPLSEEQRQARLPELAQRLRDDLALSERYATLSTATVQTHLTRLASAAAGGRGNLAARGVLARLNLPLGASEERIEREKERIKKAARKARSTR